MMFWYSSNVTLLSSVFLRATLIFLLGVRAWAVAASTAKAVKRILLRDVWAARVAASGTEEALNLRRTGELFKLAALPLSVGCDREVAAQKWQVF